MKNTIQFIISFCIGSILTILICYKVVPQKFVKDKEYKIEISQEDLEKMCEVL